MWYPTSPQAGLNEATSAREPPASFAAGGYASHFGSHSGTRRAQRGLEPSRSQRVSSESGAAVAGPKRAPSTACARRARRGTRYLRKASAKPGPTGKISARSSFAVFQRLKRGAGAGPANKPRRRLAAVGPVDARHDLINGRLGRRRVRRVYVRERGVARRLVDVLRPLHQEVRSISIHVELRRVAVGGAVDFSIPAASRRQDDASASSRPRRRPDRPRRRRASSSSGPRAAPRAGQQQKWPCPAAPPPRSADRRGVG